MLNKIHGNITHHQEAVGKKKKVIIKFAIEIAHPHTLLGTPLLLNKCLKAAALKTSKI